MRLIETHAHIYSDDFKEDLNETLDKAKGHGVERIYMPNINSKSIDAMLEVEANNPDYCIATMGLHPCYVKEDFEKELATVEDWLNKRDFVSIGEIGIDLYWDKTFKEQQEEAFKVQVQWSIERDIPFIIHARESTEEILNILEPMQQDKMQGVFHCFSGDLSQAKRAMELGFYLGLGGVSTFKNGGLKELIPDLDLNKIVLETDCPYLAPVPHRGKRNEPAYIRLIAEQIASLKLMSLSEVGEITSKNADQLFKWNK